MNYYTTLKFKRSILFPFLFLSFLFPSFSQQDSTLLKQPKGTYQFKQINSYGTYSELGIIPEIHGFKYLTIGLNIAYVKSFVNGWVGTKSFFQVGAEYLPQQKIIAPKIKYWNALWIGPIGLNGGVNSLYYLKKETSSFALRPEVGICIAYFQINYGYTFLFNNKFDELNPNTFILSCYLPF